MNFTKLFGSYKDLCYIISIFCKKSRGNVKNIFKGRNKGKRILML